MKRLSWLLAGAFVLALATPALAGDGECSANAEACLAKFAEKMDNYGWVGIELDKSEETGAMFITRVVPESPAQKAGFQEGDVLYALNGVKMAEENKDKMYEARGEWVPGQEVTYTVKRDKKKVDVALTLGNMPREVLAQWVGNHMLDQHTQLASAQ